MIFADVQIALFEPNALRGSSVFLVDYAIRILQYKSKTKIKFCKPRRGAVILGKPSTGARLFLLLGINIIVSSLSSAGDLICLRNF